MSADAKLPKGTDNKTITTAQQAKIDKLAKQAKLDKDNEARIRIAAFLATRTAKAEVFVEVKAKRKTNKRSTVKKLGKEGFILLQIYLAGDAGITYEQLVACGANRIDPVTGLDKWESPTSQEHVYSAVSEITINHNWNKKETTEQRGELKLRDPQKVDKKTTRKSIGEVYFTSDDTGNCSKNSGRKTNNLITLVIGHDEVKAFLVGRGATELDFNPVAPEATSDDHSDATSDTVD